MFVKLGALALFVSLAAALQVTVTPSNTFPNGAINVKVTDVYGHDGGNYNFVLFGPAKYGKELGHSLPLFFDTDFPFTIPADAPNGRNYFIGLARSHTPQVILDKSNVFVVGAPP